MRPHLSLPMPSRQRGVVLIIALIILLALTIIGVSGMSTTSMQERMSANTRDRQIAFQAAEAALREGESFIANNAVNPIDFDTTCTGSSGGMCDCSDKTVGCVEYWTDSGLAVWTTAGRHKTYSINYTQVAAQPEYIIEYMGYTDPGGNPPGYVPGTNPGDPKMFRITAVGTGQSPNAKVMLQSTYKKD